MSSLTLADAPRAALPADPGPGPTAALRRRILVVDDDPGVLCLVEELLEAIDADVETCSDPETALARFAEGRHDVVISDDRMPKMSGRDLLAKLRRSSPETPTILITGYSSPEKVVEAYERTGVFSFVHKPWNNRELLETVRVALRARTSLS